MMAHESGVSITPYNYVQVKEGYYFGTFEKDHIFGRMNAIVDGNGAIPVLPMDGWRSRNFAEEFMGARDASLLTLGTAKLVRAEFMQDLQGWDGKNTQYLERFKGIVIVEVVAINPGYGCYVSVEQTPSGAKEVDAYYEQVAVETPIRRENFVQWYNEQEQEVYF